MRHRVAIVGSVLACLAAGPASAEPVRSGFLIGASLGGGGGSGCDGCDRITGGLFEVHLGGWLSPRFALSYDAWGVFGDPTELASPTFQGFGLASATVRLSARAWLRAGLGVALFRPETTLVDELTGEEHDLLRGFGAGTAAGYELYQSRGSFVVEVNARLGVGMFPDRGASTAGGLALGVAWN